MVPDGVPTGGTTTLSGNNNLYANVGTPSGTTVRVQNIRAGGTPITVTITSDNTGVPTFTASPTSGAPLDLTIPVLGYRSPTSVGAGGIAFDPIAVGTVNVDADATAQNILQQPLAFRSSTITP